LRFNQCLQGVFGASISPSVLVEILPCKLVGYSISPSKLVGYSISPSKLVGYSISPSKLVGYSTP